MANLITITFDSSRVSVALERLAERMSDHGPVLKAIGDALVESTKRRFDTGTSPDGNPWPENSPVTMDLAEKRRTGKSRIGGEKRYGNKPLLDTGTLKRTINYQVEGDTLYVGTDRFSEEWPGGAAVLQFGTTHAGRGNTITIPARPFLGISVEDENVIEKTVMDYISGLAD